MVSVGIVLVGGGAEKFWDKEGLLGGSEKIDSSLSCRYLSTAWKAPSRPALIPAHNC